MGAQVQVAQREEVAVRDEDPALGVDQAVAAAAGLGALAAVAAPSADGVAHVALPAVRDTQRPVDETLELQGGAGADGPDLVQAQLAGQDDAPEANGFQEGDPRGGVVVHLGAGDEGQGREVRFEQAHILDDGGVDANVVEPVQQANGLGQLVVVEQGVDGDIDPRPVAVGVPHQSGDVLERIAGPGAGAELGRADIDGVGAAVDGGASDVEVLGRGEELDLCHGVDYTPGWGVVPRMGSGGG